MSYDPNMGYDVWIEATLHGRKGRATRTGRPATHSWDEWLFVPDEPKDEIDHDHPKQGDAGFELHGTVVGPPPWWKYHGIKPLL
jgi:hypothetical protein